MKAFLMFLVFLGVARHVYGDCPEPTRRENMDLITGVQFPAPEGTSVTFKCQEGYRWSSGTVTCSNGQWSNLQLTCERINCGFAGVVEHGQVNYHEGNGFGSTVHVVCDKHYHEVGIENKLSCGATGWTGRLATCEPNMCDPPNQIAHGHFSPKKEKYQFSEVVTYKCYGGYRIKGSRFLVCTADGQFDKAPPTCFLTECPHPQIKHGIVASGSRPYTLSTSVTFRCDAGYDMVGLDTVSCDIYTRWSPDLPTCNPTECKAPEIKNGVLEDDSLTYKFSETVTLKCSEGYKLTGDSTLTCGEKGQWSGTFPECTLIQYTAPKVEGDVLMDDRPMYKLTGDSTLTCGEKGQWSPKLPEFTLNNTLLILLVALGVACGIAGIGAGVYFGLVKKTKGTDDFNKNDPVLQI